MRGTGRQFGGLKIAVRKFTVVFSIVFSVCFLCLAHQVGSAAGVLSGDRSYLLALKESITRGSCDFLSDWKESDAHPCAWSGVTCDPITLRVVSLRIVGKRRSFTRTQISMCRRRFTHASAGPNSQIDSLDAEPISCPLRGTLSPAVWKLTQLRQLSITFNGISGELSKDVAKLSFLQTLDLRSNCLTGRLPSELGKLPNLRVLNLDHNAFQGPIPDELSLCHELRRLSLAGNVLSGRIPPSLGSLPQLHWLSLSNNRFVGSIPKELAISDCTLSHLDLSRNQLTDPIPPELGECPLLKWLVLSFNQLDGSIQANVGQLSRLKALQVAGNSLSGLVPAQLAICSKLEVVVLTMQQEAFKSCLNLREGNSLKGKLPPKLGRLARLLVLWAPGAGRSGVFPMDWGRCESVQGLNLAGNAFIGKLSPGLSNCKRLVFLYLSSNQLTGNITLQQPMKCLRVFNASINVVLGSTAEISSESERFSPLCLKRVGYAGSESWGKVWWLVFTGGPTGGSHPCSVFFKPGRINWFDSQANLATAMLRDLSFNNFKGGVSLATSRRSTLAEAFSPDKLTAAAGSLPPHLLYSDQQSDTKKLNSILVAAITSGCAIAGALFILGILFQCTRQRSPAGPLPQRGRKAVITFMNINHQLTYENVVRATGNFSIDNLIGSGGFGATYKAEVKPGLLVAVKRLAIGRFQGVQQFDTEIRTLGRIRHPNLVTLIGYHASHEEMFLIYNFFSKGNLETLIHSCRDEMDWRTRHNVALRIAEALAYLHDDCVPRVLHRDIKPSNILLDDELNAHLSDFGLARLLGSSETHATTDVAGTFGYVAPEYAMTCRVTEKADVYSYGVVLLELLSSKRALDPSFCEYGDGFNIVSWACLLIRRSQASEVFSTKLWENGPQKSLLEALKLAVLCTVDQLSVRPTMKEVVNCLGKIRPEASTS